VPLFFAHVRVLILVWFTYSTFYCIFYIFPSLFSVLVCQAHVSSSNYYYKHRSLGNSISTFFSLPIVDNDVISAFLFIFQSSSISKTLHNFYFVALKKILLPTTMVKQSLKFGKMNFLYWKRKIKGVIRGFKLQDWWILQFLQDF
jgi:hypothetical protein